MDTLYELTQQYKTLLDWGDDPDVDEDCWLDTICAIEDDLEAKADGYANLIKAWKAQAKMLDDEAKRLTARKETLENSINRLKRNLEGSMIETGKTKFKTDRFSYWIQKNTPSVVVAPDLDINAIPEEYVKVTKEVNNTAVKDALKEGKKLNWAKLQQTESIRIR